jgi:site-specific recombinase XerD
MVQNGSWEWLLEGFKFDLETEVKPRTVEYYYDHARLFVRWAQNRGRIANPHFVNKRDIQNFLYHLTQATEISVGGNCALRQVRRTDASRWHYYRGLKRFFEWAVREGCLPSNPVDGIKLKPPKSPPIEPWRPEQIDRMFQVLEHDWRVARTARQKMLAARDNAVLKLFLESGLRLSEVAGLKVEDVYLERQRVLVREGKTGKGRWVGFGPQTKKALWRYFGLRPVKAEGDAVWLSEEGRPLARRGVQEIFRRLKRDAGLRHVRGSVHKCRHTWATSYLRHTHDMRACQILLGHTDLDMTMKYTAFVEAEDALRAYDDSGPLDWIMDKKQK